MQRILYFAFAFFFISFLFAFFSIQFASAQTIEQDLSGLYAITPDTIGWNMVDEEWGTRANCYTWQDVQYPCWFGTVNTETLSNWNYSQLYNSSVRNWYIYFFGIAGTPQQTTTFLGVPVNNSIQGDGADPAAIKVISGSLRIMKVPVDNLFDWVSATSTNAIPQALYGSTNCSSAFNPNCWAGVVLSPIEISDTDIMNVNTPTQAYTLLYSLLQSVPTPLPTAPDLVPTSDPWVRIQSPVQDSVQGYYFDIKFAANSGTSTPDNVLIVPRSSYQSLAPIELPFLVSGIQEYTQQLVFPTGFNDRVTIDIYLRASTTVIAETSRVFNVSESGFLGSEVIPPDMTWAQTFQNDYTNFCQSISLANISAPSVESGIVGAVQNIYRSFLILITQVIPQNTCGLMTFLFLPTGDGIASFMNLVKTSTQEVPPVAAMMSAYQDILDSVENASAESTTNDLAFRLQIATSTTGIDVEMFSVDRMTYLMTDDVRITFRTIALAALYLGFLSMVIRSISRYFVYNQAAGSRMF